MTDIRIRRLRKRYRVADDPRRETDRLDQVLRDAIDSELIEAALDRAGIHHTDEICIRRTSSFARCDGSDSNARIAAAWSMSIADAIAEALRKGGPNVVLYGSIHHALLDMATSAIGGDFSRVWAWQQLGIWCEKVPADRSHVTTEVLAALVENPFAAAPVMHELATRGVLMTLARELSRSAWQQLAANVLFAYGRHDVFEQLSTQHLFASRKAGPAARDTMSDAMFGRVLEKSMILKATANAMSDHVVARIIALFALIECEPGAVTLSLPAIASSVERLAQSVVIRESSTPNTRKSVDVAENALTQARGVEHMTTASSRDEPKIQERDSGGTDFGGLLFLLNILDVLDPAALSASSALADRSLRWILQQLAMILVPVEHPDPAALAFAGLGPSAESPSRDAPLPSDTEAMALADIRQSVIGVLRDRVGPLPAESDSGLLSRVCTRRAVIVADPGWLEVRLDLSEVATDLRRGGLDLDPGWLPWLGAVVRFVYA
jgi:hypothetical protein